MNDSNARCNDAARSELILRCKHGDQRAFAQLVEETQHLAYALALRLLVDEDEARDAVQESFISVWRHLAAFAANSEGIEEYTRRLRFAESVWKHDYRVRIQLPGG